MHTSEQVAAHLRGLQRAKSSAQDDVNMRPLSRHPEYSYVHAPHQGMKIMALPCCHLDPIRLRSGQAMRRCMNSPSIFARLRRRAVEGSEP
jgi:hypothetical protein